MKDRWILIIIMNEKSEKYIRQKDNTYANNNNLDRVKRQVSNPLDTLSFYSLRYTSVRISYYAFEGYLRNYFDQSSLLYVYGSYLYYLKI